MLIFVIPLKAKGASADWEGCVARFRQTVQSCYRQTNPNFRILISCDEKIDLGFEDERIEFLVSDDIPLPKSWEEKVRNKSWKQLIAAVRIKEILQKQKNPEQGIYVMSVDADDLVSSRLAQFAEDYPNENGFVSKYGYVWHENQKYVQRYKDMHRYCGSCNVIKMYLEDLPDTVPVETKYCYDPVVCRGLNSKYIIRKDHGKVVDIYASKGKTFSVCPFVTTVYRLSTGDNISSEVVTTGRGMHLGVWLRKINPFDKRMIGKRVRRDFGI